MTMPDPRDPIWPDGQPPADQASMGHEPAHGTPAPREAWSPAATADGNSSGPGREATASSSDPSALRTETRSRRAHTERPVLKSFGDLLRAAYGGTFTRVNPTKADIAALCSASKLESAEREGLLGLSASDRTLERTFELMLLSMERFDAAALVGQVREFVREVLRRHPAFHAEALAAVLADRPDGPGEEGAVRTLTSQSYATLPWPEGLGVLNKKEAEHCRVNALCCLLLWFRETRGITLERIQRYLETSVWAPAARRHKTDPQKLRVLMSSRGPAGIGVACSVLEKQASVDRQQAAAAHKAAERTEMRAKELENRLTEVEAQLQAAKVQVERLSEENGSLRSSHETERAHMRNDYEDLRGRVLRRLREDTALLEEGLHALRRDPPKVHVMEDHAERAIDALKREMGRIRGDG